MTAVVTVCAGLFGLLIGSFLNVVIWRVPRGESVARPGSHCPACDVPLGARDNVPVLSWLVLHGRCRRCAEPISARYPVVEAVTAALFAVMALHFGADPALPAFLYLVAVGVALAAIDLDTRRLPDALTLPSYAVGVVLLGVAALVNADAWAIIRALIGMAALYAFYFALAWISPRGMGFGDVKLAGVLGLFLGYLGWEVLIVGGFLGFLIGGVLGVALMLLGRAGRRSTIPFGPSMIAGAWVAVLVGATITDAYLGVALG